MTPCEQCDKLDELDNLKEELEQSKKELNTVCKKYNKVTEQRDDFQENADKYAEELKLVESLRQGLIKANGIHRAEIKKLSHKYDVGQKAYQELVVKRQKDLNENKSLVASNIGLRSKNYNQLSELKDRVEKLHVNEPVECHRADVIEEVLKLIEEMMK